MHDDETKKDLTDQTSESTDGSTAEEVTSEPQAAAPAPSDASPSAADVSERIKEQVANLNQKKDQLLSSDEFKQAQERAGDAWGAMLNSPGVDTLAQSKFGDVMYGIGPIKSFADGRCPDDPTKARRLASFIGAGAAMFVLSLALVLVMPTPSGSSSGSKSRSRAVARSTSTSWRAATNAKASSAHGGLSRQRKQYAMRSSPVR